MRGAAHEEEHGISDLLLGAEAAQRNCSFLGWFEQVLRQEPSEASDAFRVVDGPRSDTIDPNAIGTPFPR